MRGIDQWARKAGGARGRVNALEQTKESLSQLMRVRMGRISVIDAVDGSSTGIQVPHCGCC